MKDTKCESNLPHFQPEGGLWGGRLLLAQEDDFHSNGSFQVAKNGLSRKEDGYVLLPKGDEYREDKLKQIGVYCYLRCCQFRMKIGVGPGVLFHRQSCKRLSRSLRRETTALSLRRGMTS